MGTLWRFNRKIKTLIAKVMLLFLCWQVPFFPPGVEAATNMIVPDYLTETFVEYDPNNNVFDITTDTIIGDRTGLNSFEQFDVWSGYTANLYVPDGAQNLVNVVHSKQSVIDGVLNSIKDGEIGGNVYFLNPHGMVIGKSGVVNVGSFHFTSPTNEFMEQFHSNRHSAVSQILAGQVPITPSGRITVEGTINAIGDISLLTGQVSSTGLIQSGAEFEFTAPSFSDVVNVAGFQSGGEMTVQGGQIKIVATGGSVELDSGSALFTGGDDGDIEIEAVGTPEFATELGGTRSQAVITIDGATLIGNDVSIRAVSEAEHTWEADAPLLAEVLDLLDDPLGAEIGIVQADAEAKVSIDGDSTIRAAGDVSIEAASSVMGRVTVEDGAQGALIGVLHGKLVSDAKVTVGSQATIDAKNLELASTNQASLELQIRAGAPLSSAALAVAVGDVVVNSSAAIDRGAEIRLTDSLSVNAVNTSSFIVGADSVEGEEGFAGVAASVLVASTSADARVDADLLGLKNVTIAAQDEIAANIATAQTSDGPVGPGLDQSKSKFSSTVGWLRGKIGQSGQKAKSQTPKVDDESGVMEVVEVDNLFNLGGAVTVVVADHGALANIGDGAVVNASESVSVTAEVQDRNQQARAVSGVMGSSPDGDGGALLTLGGALVVGHFGHEARAWVGDGAWVAGENVQVASTVERTQGSSNFEWDAVKTIHDKLDKKQPWTSDLLSGMASSTTRAGDQGVGGAATVLFLQFDTDTEAYIGENARIQLKGGKDTGLTVSAFSNVSGAFAAGTAITPPPSSSDGEGAMDSFSVGGSITVVNYLNSSRAYVGKGAVIEAEDTGDVSVWSRADLRQFAISPGVGAGDKDGLGLNGNLALSLILSESEASIDDEASVTAQDVVVDATTDVTAFALSGGYHREGDKHLSASVAGQIIQVDTRAFVGDNDHHRDTDAPAGPAGLISAENLSVSARTGTRVDSFTTDSSNSASVAVSIVDVDTMATLFAAPQYQIRDSVTLRARNEQDFMVNATTAAKDGEIAGIASAILITNTDAVSENRADLYGIKDLTIAALDETTRTRVTSTTTVTGSQSGGSGGSGGSGDSGDVSDEELGDGTGESGQHTQVSGIRAKIENVVGTLMGNKKPAQSAEGQAGLDEAGVDKDANNLAFPKLGGAVTVVVADHHAASRIADGVAIDASGNVAVAAQTRQSLLQNMAQTAVKSQGGHGSNGLPLTLSSAIVLGVYSYGAEATIGQGADITARNVGVRADVIRAYDVAWHKWEGISTITQKLKSNLGIPDGFLTGYTSATGKLGTKELGITGSLLVMSFTNNSLAEIGDGARITVLSGSDEKWSSHLTVSEKLEWDGGVSVSAGTEQMGAFAAGSIDITLKGMSGGQGSVALGGSMADVNHINSTMSRIGKGVVIQSQSGAAAPDVAVNALTNEGLVVIAPTAGRGMSYGVSGNMALAVVVGETLAHIDDDAQIVARDLRIDAEENIVSFAVTGEFNQTESLSVGVGVSVQVVDAKTEARLGKATITAQSVSVAARTDGIIESISVAGALAMSKDPNTKSTSWTTKVKDGFGMALNKVKDLMSKKDKTSPDEVRAAGEAIDNADDKSARPDELKPDMGSGLDEDTPGDGGSGQPGGPGGDEGSIQGPSFGVGISGSSSVNVVVLETIAAVDGSVIQLTGGSGDSDRALSVVAVTDTDIGAFSGSAALVRAKNPSSSFNVGVAGALAVNVLTNRTEAIVRDAEVRDARDVSVHALAGGDQVAVALGLDVNASGKDSKLNATVAGSVSANVVANTISAGIAESQVRGGSAGSQRGVLDVSAYDRTRLGSGGGAIMGGGKAGVGGAMTYTGIHKGAEAYVSGSTVSRFTDVVVRGLNASMIAAGGAMGGLHMDREGVSFEGAWVVSVITNTTAGRIEGSTLNNVGDVTVIARDVHSFAGLDEVLDLRDCKGEECEEEGHEQLIDHAGSDVRLDGSMEAGAETLQAGRIGEIETAVADADEGADSKTDEALDGAGQSGTRSAGSGGRSAGWGGVGTTENDDEDDGAYFGGSSIVSTAGVVQAGSNNIGLSFVWNTIANEFIAEVVDSAIEADGDLDVVAQSNATIIGAAVGAGAGDKVGGGGSLSANHTINQVVARISGTTSDHVVDAANVTVRATDRSDISSLAGNVGLVGGSNGAAAVGASVAFSGINNTVHASIEGIDVDSTGHAQVTARNNSAVRTFALSAAATDGTAAVAGSASISEIANHTIAEIVSDRDNTVNVGSLEIGATDGSSILSLSGQVTGADKAAVGAAGAINWVSNTTRSRIVGANVDADGDVALTSRNHSWIGTLGVSAGGAQTAAVNGAAIVSVIFNHTEAEVIPAASAQGDPTTINSIQAGNLTIEATDAALIVALGGQAGGASTAAVGGSAVLSHIFNTTRASLASEADVAGQATIAAQNWSQIYAFSASGGGSGNSAVNGSLVFSFVGNRTIAQVSGESGAKRIHVGSLTVDAEDTSIIGSLAGAVSGSGTAAVGGAANVGTIANTTHSSVRLIDIEATEVSLHAANWALIAAIAASVQGSGTAAVGGSLVVNTVINNTVAEIVSDGTNTVKSSVALNVGAEDVSGIYTVAGGISGAGAAGVGAGVATSWVFNTTEALIADVDIQGSADGHVNAENASRIVSVGATGQGGGSAGVGATISTNVIANTTSAEVRSTSGNSLAANRLTVLSKDASEIYSIGVQISGAGAAAVGGTLAVSEIANTTRSRIAGVTANVAGETRVDAQNESIIAGFAATGGGAATADVRGSLVFSGINNITVAEVRGGSLTSRSLVVNASDWSLSISGSGQIGGAGVAAVGAAAAVAEIGNRTHARIAGAQVTASDAVSVTASNDSLIITAAASAGGAEAASVRGSDTTNLITNRTIAEVCAIGQCEDDEEHDGGAGALPDLATGSLSVKAVDTSQIWSVSGQAGGAAHAAVGGSLAHNQTLNATIASVAGYSTHVSGTAEIDAANRSEIRSLAASGGGSFIGASVQGSVASSHVNNWTEARMTGGAATDQRGDYSVRAVDEAYIGSISGQVAANFWIGAGVGAAVSVNQIGNTTQAYVSGSASGTQYDVGNLLVKSHSRSHIDSIAAGAAYSTVGAGVSGSTAIDLINNQTLAYIDGGARVRAQDNVGVVAWNDDIILNAAGNVTVGLAGAGLGASVTVSEIAGRTAAYIEGEDTSVTALAQSADRTIEIAEGGLDAIDLEDGLDMTTPQDLEDLGPWVRLSDHRRTQAVRGVSVNASATHQVLNVVMNVSGGGGGVNAMANVTVVAGTTEAYVDRATVNAPTDGSGSAAQSLHVGASDHSLASNFIGSLGIGLAGGAGSAVNTNVFVRETRAYIANSDDIRAENGVDVRADSTQSVTSVVVGGAAGGTTMDEQYNVGVFAGSTESFIQNSTVRAGFLNVDARHTSRTAVAAGAARVGLLGTGRTLVVGVASHTTRAFVDESTVSATGLVSVSAMSNSEAQTWGFTGGIGGLDLSGVAVVNAVSNTTESFVRGSNLGSSDERVGSLSVTALDRVTAKNIGGQLGFGIGAGGPILAITYVGNQTSSYVDDSRVYAGGRAAIEAQSERYINTIAAATGAGGLTYSGVIAVTLLGAVKPQELLTLVDGDENLSLSVLDQLLNQDRIVLEGDKQNTYLPSDADYSFDFEAEVEDGEDRVFSVQREDPVDPSVIVTANTAGRGGVKETILQGGGGSTTARVSGGSVIDARGDIRVEADVHDLANLSVGSIGAAIGAVGAGIGLLYVGNEVQATVAEGSRLNTSSGTIAIQAQTGRLDRNTGSDIVCDAGFAVSVCALQGTGGLGAAIGAAVATAFVSNNVYAVAERGTALNASGSGAIEIYARDQVSVNAEAKGLQAAAGVAAGAVMATATKSGTSLAIIGDENASGAEMTVHLGDGRLTVESERSGRVRAYSLAGSGGILSAVASTAAYATDDGKVRAVLGNRVSVNGAADVALLAKAVPQTEAEVGGYSGSVLNSLGASIANATAKPIVETLVAEGGTIQARSLSVGAIATQAGDAMSASSVARGAGLGILAIGATASISEATSASQVTTVFGSRLQVSGNVTIAANNATAQHAESYGLAAGTMATGASVSHAASSSSTIAQVLDSASGVVGGRLTVGASGFDATYSFATSETGGIAAGAAADARTHNNSTTVAELATAALGIVAGRLDVVATHVAELDGRVDTWKASVAGMSGARTHHNVNSVVSATVLDRAKILTEDLSVAARNLTRRLERESRAGSGGFLDGAAIVASAHIDHQTDVNVGEGVAIDVVEGDQGLGRAEFIAVNDIEAHERALLDSGGALTIAAVTTDVSIDVDASVNVGRGTQIDADADMTLGTLSLLDVTSESYAKTFALSSAAMGSSDIHVQLNERVGVGKDVSLRSGDHINLLAGKDATGKTNYLVARAITDVYNQSALAIVTDPEARSLIERDALILVDEGASVRAVGDVNLLTDNGTAIARGNATAIDASRELAEKVAKGFQGAILRGGVLSLETKKGDGDVTTRSGVVVRGDIEAGIQNKQWLIINADGSVESQSEGVTFVERRESLETRLTERLEELERLKTTFASDPAAVAAFNAEISFVKNELERLGADASGNVHVDFIIVDDVVAKGGNINVSGKYLAGSGNLRASADPEIKIENHSAKYLRVNQLTVDDRGGYVYFNGAQVSSSQEINERNESGAPTADFSIQAVGSDDWNPMLIVRNTFIPLPGTNLRAPDIEIAGDVTNRTGTIDIHNARGSIKIQAADGVAPSITAHTVQLRAEQGTILQSYNPGFVHIGGDPRSLWRDVAEFHERSGSFAERLWYLNRDLEHYKTLCPDENGSGSACNQLRRIRQEIAEVEALRDSTDEIAGGGSSWIAGNDILISARYLNINGTIQSGIPNWSLQLTNQTAQQIEAWREGWIARGKPEGELLQLSGMGGSGETATIGAFYDPVTNRIIVEGLEVRGGYVELSGQIMNTRGGHIKALDGFARININTTIPYDIVLNNIDTGGVAGVVRITDTAKTTADGTPITTVYERVGGQVRTQRWAGGTLLDEIFTDGRTTVYTPRENQRFVWVRGQDSTDWITGHKTADTWFEFIPGETHQYDEYSWESGPIKDLGNGPYMEFSSLEEMYHYLSSGWRTVKDWYILDDLSEHWETCDGIPLPVGGVCLGKKTLHWKIVEERKEQRTMTHSVKADLPITVEFIGYDQGNGHINVNVGNSQSNLIIAGSLINRGGEVSLVSSRGIRTETDAAVILGQSIYLRANQGDIGSTAAPIRIGAADDAVRLRADASRGSVFLESTRGTTMVNYITGTNVVFHAQGDILQYGTSSSNRIGAYNIDLRSASGRIGSADRPLNVSLSGSPNPRNLGGLTAVASGDIYLQSPGSLRLVEVKSTGGDVWIESVSGSLIDFNKSEQRDERTIEELERLWEDLMLVDEAAELSAQNALDAYAASRRSEYETYWRLRGFTPIVDETTGEVTGYQAKPYDPDVVDPRIMDPDKFVELHALYGEGTYDPNFVYVLSDEEIEELTQGAMWSKSQLQQPISRAILYKQTTSTETRIEEPNIIGRNVTLIARNGSVGADLGELVIDGNDPDAFLDEEVRLRLAAAEADDVGVDNETGLITIVLRDSLDVAATGEILVEARDHVYLGSREPIYVKTVESGGSIRIKGTEGLYSVATSGEATVRGGSVILEGGDGGIGTPQSPVTLDLHEGASVIARAAQDIHLASLRGNLNIAQIFGRNGVHLTAAGSILRSGESPVSIEGGAIRLTARGGSIGTESNPLLLLVTPSGILHASSADGEGIYARGVGTILNVGDLAAGDRIVLTSEGHIGLQGSISAPASFVLTAAGSVTQQVASVIDTHRFAIVSDGAVSLDGQNKVARFFANNQGAGDITFTNVSGNLVVDGITQSSGNVSISNRGGHLMIAQAIQLGMGVEPVGDVYLAAEGEISQSEGAIIVGASLVSTSSFGAQTLDQGNRVLRFRATNSGDGNISFSNTSTVLEIAGISQANDGTVKIDQTGSLEITGVVETAGTAILKATGSIGQAIDTGAVKATFLDVTVGGRIELNGPNAVRQLRVVNSGPGVVAISNAAESLEILEIEQVAGGAVTVHHTGRLVVGTIRGTAQDVVTLSATSNIEQREDGNWIEAGTLRTVSVGGVTLVDNVSVQRFEAENEGGDMVLVVATPDGLLELGDVTQNGGDVDITSDGGVKIAGRMGATGKTEVVRITARGRIQQDTADGGIKAWRLVTSSDGGQQLVGANHVGQFEAVNTGAGKIVLVNSAESIEIIRIEQVDGGDIAISGEGQIEIAGAVTTSDDVQIDAAGDVAIAGIITTDNGVVRLTAAGRITQDDELGSIHAGLLTVSSKGGQRLGGGNRVAVYESGNAGGGEILFANTSEMLEVLAVSQSDGGDVNLGNVGRIVVGTIDTRDGVGLNATRTITQAEGASSIDAASLHISSVGGAMLNRNIAVDAFEAVNTTGDIVFATQSGSVELRRIEQVDGGDIVITGDGRIVVAGVVTTSDDVRIDAAGRIESTDQVDGDGSDARVDAAHLRLSSEGGVSLAGANTVDRFEAINRGGGVIEFANTSDVLVVEAIRQVDGGDIVIDQDGRLNLPGEIVTSDAVLLSTAEKIVQEAATGVVDAGLLMTASSGGQMLKGANSVSRFQATNAGGEAIALLNTSESLDIGYLRQIDGGDIDIDQTGAIEISGEVAANGKVRLITTSSIAQIGEGRIRDAAILVTSSNGGQILTGDNTIGSIWAVNKGGGDVVLRNSAERLDIVNIGQEGGDVVVEQMGDVAVVGSVQTDLDVFLSASGDIENHNVDDLIILSGRNVDLVSAHGYIGQDVSRIVVSAQAHVNAAAKGDIFLEVRGGELRSEWIRSESGSVDLLASDGISVAQMSLARSARLRADWIRVDEMIHVGEEPLRLVVHGVSGLAESVVIHASSDAGIVFDRLEANYALVDADTDMLHFHNTRIERVGEFNNRHYSVRVDNVNRALFDVDLQLYEPKRDFHLRMGAERKMETDALIFNYNPDIDLGESGNQMSVMKLVTSLPYVFGNGSVTQPDAFGDVHGGNGEVEIEIHKSDEDDEESSEADEESVEEDSGEEEQ